MDEAKERLREGMHSAKSAASDTRDYVSEKYGEAKDRLHHMSDDARERWDHLRDTDYDEVWDGVKNSVRENPGPALLIAGAVGLAIGVLLAGSSAATSRHR
jgi:ElaB/YqjD/DUF883 family membrane-anchored ribosome-binding protein